MGIRRVLLDVDKAIQRPEIIEITAAIDSAPGVAGVNITVTEIDVQTLENRKRDLEAHHQHVHAYNSNTIAAGIIVVNPSQTFQSPLRAGLTIHTKPPAELIRMVADELNSVTTSSGTTPVGLDAKCLIAVNMDNVNLSSTSYYVKRPAPAVGSPLHWDSFIQRLCDLYNTRWP